MTLLAISNKYNLCVNLMQERAAAALLFSLKFWSLRLSKSSRGFFDQSLEIELPTLVFGTVRYNYRRPFAVGSIYLQFPL